jgi:hypothetical protein
VKFEVLEAANINSTVFWEVMRCSLVKFTDVSEECTASISVLKGDPSKVFMQQTGQ